MARLLLAFGMLLFALLAQALEKPAYPVIFIHGINSDASTWGKFSSALQANDWSNGGSPRWDGSKVIGVTAGHFYTLNYPDSYRDNFSNQGAVLAKIISAVLAANPTKNKVILVAHSMGGLAARAYLQGQAGIPFGGDVDTLITIGTPHQGSMEAEHCLENTDCSSKINCDSPNAIDAWNAVGQGCSLVSVFLHPDSVAFNALIPESTGLNALNSFPGNVIPPFSETSLPPDVHYVSVVVSWGNRNTLTRTKPSLAWADGGDGIVTETSQDLSKVPGFTSLPAATNHTPVSVKFNDDPGPNCGHQITFPFGINEVHTCETHYAKILGKILFPHIIATGNVTASTGAPSVPRTATPQVAIQGEVSFEAFLTNAFFKYGTAASSLNLTVAPTQTFTGTSGTTQLSATLPTTLVPGTTYYYRLVAETDGGVAAGGQTAVGQVHEVTIPPAAGIGALLPAPTGLSPESGVFNQPLTPTLTWNTVADATSYRIMLAQDASALPTDPTDGNCDRCLVDFVPGTANRTSYTPPAGLLTSGSTYYWQVHARSPDNFGTWTAPSSFTTQSASPATLLPAPTQTAPNDGDTGQSTMPTLSWAPVTGATSYRIMIAPTAAGLTTDPTNAGCASCLVNAIAHGAQGTTYVPNAGFLAVGSTYYWSVKARSPDSYGAWSPVRSFTPSTEAQIVTEFSAGITFNSAPSGITTGPDGNLWFTEFYSSHVNGNRIGRITPAGVVTEFKAGITAGAGPYGITTGPDGNLWFTETNTSGIGRITPAGVVTEFKAGITAGAYPVGITAGPDGNLWFTEGVGRIGRITTDGVVTEFSAGITAYAGPRDITTGPDGNLWFTEYSGNRIGRITPAGVVTEFSAGITAGAEPTGITTGPDGNLWFTEINRYKGNRIGRITPAGVVTEFSAGISAGAQPTGITTGPDGNLWFTEPGTGVNRIGRITPAGVVTEFSAGISANPRPYGITTGPDGNLWFTEDNFSYDLSRIGRITIGGSSGTTIIATTTTTTTTTTTAASTTTTTLALTTTTTIVQTTTTTVASTTTTTVAASSGTLNLVTGWNLVGNSSSGSLDVASAFGDTSNVMTVWKWIANAARWAFYAPSLSGQALTDYVTSKGYDVLTTINSGEGFWVNAKTTFTAPLPVGTAITSVSFQTGLPTGWNLIAVGDSPTPRAFNSTIKVTTLWAWDAVNTNWYFYAPSLDAQGGSVLSNYITSKSYLDFGTKTIDPTMGFWVNRPNSPPFGEF